MFPPSQRCSYRSRLVGNRTQLSNQARAFLLERGIAVPQGRPKFAALLPDILEEADNALPYEMRVLLGDMLAEWEGLESKIDTVNRQLVTEAKSSEACGRLREIPGVGARRRQRSWRRSETAKPLSAGAMWRPGWG